MLESTMVMRLAGQLFIPFGIIQWKIRMGRGLSHFTTVFMTKLFFYSGLVDPLQSHVRFYAHFFRDGPRVTDLPEDSSKSLLATSARILGMVSRILCCCYGHI